MYCRNKTFRHHFPELLLLVLGPTGPFWRISLILAGYIHHYFIGILLTYNSVICIKLCSARNPVIVLNGHASFPHLHLRQKFLQKCSSRI